MSLLIALYLTLVIALPLALSVVVSYRTLPRTPHCPLCGKETFHIRSRLLNALSCILRNQELQKRWCATCLWEGTIRIPRPLPVNPLPQPVAETASGSRAPTVPGPSGEAISLRDLEIDGLSWRVLLQCWYDTGQWFGRLLFIAPSGRLWIDTVDPIRGSSSGEVMGKALALPDRTLACRLRELISD